MPQGNVFSYESYFLVHVLSTPYVAGTNDHSFRVSFNP